jgi:hypothetical protein
MIITRSERADSARGEGDGLATAARRAEHRPMATHDRNAEDKAEDGDGRYRTFAAFYPFYLTEHVNRTSRRLHVIGTTLVIAAVIFGFLVDWRFFVAAPLVGYGFAWVGHFVFEKNRPATFKYPLYSLAGDFRLWFEVVTGRRPF